MVGWGDESFEAESYVSNCQGLRRYPQISNDSFGNHVFTLVKEKKKEKKKKKTLKLR